MNVSDVITPQELDRRGFVVTHVDPLSFDHPLLRGTFVLKYETRLLWKNDGWNIAIFTTLSELDGSMLSVLGDAYKVAEGEPA